MNVYSGSVKNLDERKMKNKNPVSITYRFGVGMVRMLYFKLPV